MKRIMDELNTKDLHTITVVLCFMSSISINTFNLENLSSVTSLGTQLKDQQPPSRDGGWVWFSHYQGGSVPGAHICQCRY